MLKKFSTFCLALVLLLCNISCSLASAGSLDEKFSVGNYVTFGTYPQTGSGNDATPIEWLILDRDGQKALLISKYALDAHPYHDDLIDITWEFCSLRSWLNGAFLQNAFSTEQQDGILITTVDNSNTQGFSDWDTDGGNDTQDKVFLLSYAEAEKYFIDNTDRLCAPTDYAIAQGGSTFPFYTVDDRATGIWQLRSPGIRSIAAAGVNYGGALGECGSVIAMLCVRPAIWVDLDSGIF